VKILAGVALPGIKNGRVDYPVFIIKNLSSKELASLRPGKFFPEFPLQNI